MRGIHLHQPVIYAQHPTPFIPIGVYGFRRQATFLLYNGFQQCRVNLVYGPASLKQNACAAVVMLMANQKVIIVTTSAP
nr:hypothetical protein [Candidatus Hamiltonella defensa]